MARKRRAAAARFGAPGSVLPDSVLSDSKSPQRIFRRGLNCCDNEDMPVICPTCQNVFAGSLKGLTMLLCMGLFSIFSLRARRAQQRSVLRRHAKMGGWRFADPLINRHKTAVPPSALPAHSLWLRCFPDPFPDEAI